MNPVAIIGAGITGLTAAYHLRKAGFEVVVYEADDRVGGVIRSVRKGGYLAEYGPNTLLETSPKITALIAELGLGSRRMDSDPCAGARYVVRNRRPVELPMSAAGFFACRLFSAHAKLRLFVEPFIGRAAREESVAEFVQRRLGQEFLDYAIDPLVTGIYAGDPARLSIEHAFPKIQALEQRYGSLIRGQILGARERKRRGEVSKANAKKLSFDEGLQVLPDTLYAHLGGAVRLDAPVTRVTETPAGWTVTSGCGTAEMSAPHRAVVFAGTAYALARLRLDTRQPVALESFAEIDYPPVASVVLGFRREDVAHPCLGFGMLIPRREGFDILGTIFSSALFPNRAPTGHLTLTTYVGGARNASLARQSAGTLVDTTLKDLRVLLGVTGRPTYVHVYTWPQAIPQYVVGYGRFKQRMDDLERQAPGFLIAGPCRDGVALSDSILAGIRAAERLVPYLQTAAPGPPPPRAQLASP